MKESHPSIETPLSCGEHPFFVDLLNVPQERKDFFDKVFVKDENIFEGYVFDWEPMKELVLRGIFEGKQALESFIVLDVLDLVIS